jgi:hypothetical protein
MGSLFILARPGRLASPEREAVSELMSALGQLQPLTTLSLGRLLTAKSGRSVGPLVLVDAIAISLIKPIRIPPSC